ncbi:MAG: aspartyl protease family protein [Candidatus Daviesbacteria bacterium]|nr:aspartyl protease family protein [Candidatus Daviesbacteria bacterium]
MTFPYKEITPYLRRPIIPIIIKSDNYFILYHGLIDSGADHCIFSLEIAKELGLKFSKKNKITFIGAGNDEIEGFWGEIDIKIDKITYATYVIFAKISDFGHGILGQQGFFDHFDVKLSYQKQTVEIEPIRIPN